MINACEVNLKQSLKISIEEGVETPALDRWGSQANPMVITYQWGAPPGYSGANWPAEQHGTVKLRILKRTSFPNPDWPPCSSNPANGTYCSSVPMPQYDACGNCVSGCNDADNKGNDGIGNQALEYALQHGIELNGTSSVNLGQDVSVMQIPFWNAPYSGAPTTMLSEYFVSNIDSDKSYQNNTYLIRAELQDSGGTSLGMSNIVSFQYDYLSYFTDW